MKNPIKQLKKVQGALAEQAYSAYLFGHREGMFNVPRLNKKEFFNKIKEVMLEGKHLQRPANQEKMQEATP